jgi:hypothetical protein
MNVSVLVAAVLYGANVAGARSPPNQGGPADNARQSTLGTGSCSDALGSEPGCRRAQSVLGTEPHNTANSDDDQPGFQVGRDRRQIGGGHTGGGALDRLRPERAGHHA